MGAEQTLKAVALCSELSLASKGLIKGALVLRFATCKLIEVYLCEGAPWIAWVKHHFVLWNPISD